MSAEHDERPWGTYTVLDDADDHKVKRIVVRARQAAQLPAPRPARRALVRGLGTGPGDRRRRRARGGRRASRRGRRRRRAPHRERRRRADLVFIEVQRGDYFGEDDIVRLEDDFGRAGGTEVRSGVTRIADLLADGPTYSFEFFPPKSDAEQATLDATWRPRAPAPLVRLGHLPRRAGLPPAHLRPGDRDAPHHPPQPHGPPHLRGPQPARAGRHPRLLPQGRGGEPDGPGGRPPEDPADGPGELAHAAELVELARAVGGFSVGVAAHPAGHPASPDLVADRDRLAEKMALADFAVTQFFFEASEYHSLLVRSGRAGGGQAGAPRHHAGTSLSSVPRMATMGAAGARLGASRGCEAADRAGGKEAVRRAGVEMATELCRELLESGARGCTSTRSTAPARPARSTGPSGSPRAQRGRLSTRRSPDWGGRGAGRRLGAMAEKITMGPDGVLHVPAEPIIPFIEGDGTGVDIWPAAKLVLDAAAAKHGQRIEWLEVLAGEKAFNETGTGSPRRR